MSGFKKEALCVVALIILGLAFFYQTFYFGFFNIDDYIHTSENLAVLTFDLKGLLFKFYLGLYYPLTMLSFALDWWLGGSAPWMFHLSNFIFHLLGALVLFKICLKLWPKRFLLGFLISLVFLLHPLKAESVAWITERKDLLSGMFLWITVYLYLVYLERRSGWQYVFANIAYFLALASKASVVGLPVFLLVLDWYRNQKLGARVLIEKIPFLVSALFFTIMNMVAQSIHRGDVLLFPKNYFNLFYQMQFYVEKAIFPWNLRIWYTDQFLNFSLVGLLSIILISFLTVFIFTKYREERKNVLLGLSLFSLFLFPNLKLIPFGDETLVNDRYMYIALTGLTIAFFPFILRLIEKLWRDKKRAFSLVLSSLVVALLIQWVILMNVQVSYWRDPLTLWQRTAVLEPDSKDVSRNLGKALYGIGRYEEALPYFQRVRERVEDFAYLGSVLHRTGRSVGASNIILEGLKISPSDSLLLNMLGAIKFDNGEDKEALSLFTRALSSLESEPSLLLYSTILNNVGLANMRLGNRQEAERFFKQASAVRSRGQQIAKHTNSAISE